ncbi:indole-3-glycerol phosphate synthase [bacterium BMS3Abin01]|nr:indole-3-glycerol phosphate synthase [bacterium BMS3Abin01]HDZ59272.1 indole-3-glycerol phosphate synthase TrpC [Actinomycetota bacterium]
MSEFLDRILKSTREELSARKQRVPAAALERPASRPGGERFREALSRPGMSLIAEIKRASPSKGDLRPDLDPGALAADYEAGGAAAVSILTEGCYFKGSLTDLEQARAACTLPLLRKDFIIDGYQLREAVAAGADAVLLIVAALEDSLLASLYQEARKAGLECLVEVHDCREMERALAVGPAVIGINNRDLHSFEVDLATTLNLIKLVPDDVVVVSESGIGGAVDVCRLGYAGVDAILVGEALMRSSSPGDMIRQLLSS